jgi:hypothetical protein
MPLCRKDHRQASRLRSTLFGPFSYTCTQGTIDFYSIRTSSQSISFWYKCVYDSSVHTPLVRSSQGIELDFRYPGVGSRSGPVRAPDRTLIIIGISIYPTILVV